MWGCIGFVFLKPSFKERSMYKGYFASCHDKLGSKRKTWFSGISHSTNWLFIIIIIILRIQIDLLLVYNYMMCNISSPPYYKILVLDSKGCFLTIEMLKFKHLYWEATSKLIFYPTFSTFLCLWQIDNCPHLNLCVMASISLHMLE